MTETKITLRYRNGSACAVFPNIGALADWLIPLRKRKVYRGRVVRLRDLRMPKKLIDKAVNAYCRKLFGR